MFFWIGDKLCLAYRTVTVVGDISVKLMPFLDNLGTTLVNPLPSFHPLDVFVGVATAVIARLVLIYKDKHRKNLLKMKNTARLVGAMQKILSRIWTKRFC